MAKRHYYETEETIIRKKKGWIEIDTDFTQVYNCFQHISTSITNGKSWQLLFWLLINESNKSNGFRADKAVQSEFNAYLQSQSAPIVSKATFYRLIEELENAGAIKRFDKGIYFFSPYIFWSDTKQKRLEFIEAEQKDKSFHNPKLIELPKD